MSKLDLLLETLYQSPRDAQSLTLAAQHAPILYFDQREPFLPLAAGYTIFTQDGPSASFERSIELRPEDKPAARTAIEYAIWWDWDIHHLYELEHVWIYLDENHSPVRVEGSWHGKFYDIPLKLEQGRAVLLSEAGKHAFAPDPTWFHERTQGLRRVDSQNIGGANVLIKDMFAGKIRQRMFDRTLVRSYLATQAFEPGWTFSKRFVFQSQQLVPWQTLAGWIPQRVNATLEHLEATIQPTSYRALRLVACKTNRQGLQTAAQANADAVLLPLSLHGNRLVSKNNGGEALDLEETLNFCRAEPMGLFLELPDITTAEHLAWFVRSNEISDYVAVTSPDPAVLAHYQSFAPGGLSVSQLHSPDQDPLQAAQESKALFVSPNWLVSGNGTQPPGVEWVQRIHSLGLGVVGWMARSTEELNQMQAQGFDVVIQGDIISDNVILDPPDSHAS